jgi:hypothetical protein
VSVHLRMAGSCSGSSSHWADEALPRVWFSGTALIGLPHSGHAFRIGYSAAILISPAPAERRGPDGLKLVAESLPVEADGARAGALWRLDDGGSRILNSACRRCLQG